MSPSTTVCAAYVTIMVEVFNSDGTNMKGEPDVEDTDINDTMTELAQVQVPGTSET